MRHGTLAGYGWLLALCACTPVREPIAKGAMSDSNSTVPEHLKRFPGLSIRRGDQVVQAPDEDVEVARGYALAPYKGSWLDGRRITILTRADEVHAGRPVRIIHVVETIRPGDALRIMGPKPVLGEVVDGALVTASSPTSGDPLTSSGDYDGRVQQAPAVDYNYDITEYRLPVGRHVIEWQLGALRSNTLIVEVRP